MATKTIEKGKRIIGDQRVKLAGDLRKQYEAGTPIRMLAQTFGRSYGFIHRVLVESGASMRGRGGATRGPAKATPRSVPKPRKTAGRKKGSKK